MGFSFNGDGRYIGWSNLFNLSSLNTLKASEQLPQPKKREYIFNQDGKDVSNELELINSIEEQLKTQNTDELQVARINAYNTLIRKLNTIENQVNGKYGVFWNTKNGRQILDVAESHEKTKIPQTLTEDANKNFISSHIQNTVQNLRNMIGAYSPIQMEDLRRASRFSPKGQQASRLTLLNPATKMLMQRQNIVGKDVIGIAANGEKVSFMWHYWINDVISKAKTEDDLKYIRFNFQTSRVYNRSKGKPLPITVETLPEVNLENLSNKALNIFFNNKLTGDITVDLMISQVLSAATKVLLVA